MILKHILSSSTARSRRILNHSFFSWNQETIIKQWKKQQLVMYIVLWTNLHNYVRRDIFIFLLISLDHHFSWYKSPSHYWSPFTLSSYISCRSSPSIKVAGFTQEKTLIKYIWGGGGKKNLFKVSFWLNVNMAKCSETLMALIQLLLSLLPSINRFVFKVYISLDYKNTVNGSLSENFIWIKYFS